MAFGASLEERPIQINTPSHWYDWYMEQQVQWNEGFLAGMKEVLHELNSALNGEDPESPTRKWVEEFSYKVESKYF